MMMRRALSSLMTLLVSLIVGLAVPPASAHGPSRPAERLPAIGPAPDFSLTTQDGTAFSLAGLRGKVVALNFVFTRCADVCPIATHKMVEIQDQLGEVFGRDVFFVSVTVDPDNDTLEELALYAHALGCNPSGWAFLTGPPAAVRDVATSYGVFHDRSPGEEVRHNLLTSLIDREGRLRVQYMGERFDPSELLHDLRGLIAEDAGK